MFGFKKPVEPVVEEPKVDVPVEPVAPEFKPAEVTLIGEGITMIGNFESKDPIVINGSLKGNICSTNSLTISNTGSMQGEGTLNSAMIEGAVDGKIVCEKNTHFTSTGQMVGSLETATLQTDNGADFRGELKLSVKKAAPVVEAAPEAPAAEEAAAEAPAEEKPEE